MHKAAFLVVAVLALSGSANAQAAADRRAWAYVFAGGGFLSDGGPAAFNAGGGGEFLVGSGLGLGGELGLLAHSASDGLGLASANVSYHFGGRDSARDLAPFLTGGGSAAFGNRTTAGGVNFGGGLQYWLRERLALRMEVRDFIFSSDSPHTWIFRVGLAFR